MPVFSLTTDNILTLQPPIVLYNNSEILNITTADSQYLKQQTQQTQTIQSALQIKGQLSFLNSANQSIIQISQNIFSSSLDIIFRIQNQTIFTVNQNSVYFQKPISSNQNSFQSSDFVSKQFCDQTYLSISSDFVSKQFCDQTYLSISPDIVCQKLIFPNNVSQIIFTNFLQNQSYFIISSTLNTSLRQLDLNNNNILNCPNIENKIQIIPNSTQFKQLYFQNANNSIELTQNNSSSLSNFLNANMQFTPVLDNRIRVTMAPELEQISFFPNSTSNIPLISMSTIEFYLYPILYVMSGKLFLVQELRATRYDDVLIIKNSTGSATFFNFSPTKNNSFLQLDMNNNNILNCPNIENKVQKLTNSTQYKQLYFQHSNNTIVLTQNDSSSSLKFLNADMNFTYIFNNMIRFFVLPQNEEIRFYPNSTSESAIVTMRANEILFSYALNMGGNQITRVQQIRSGTSTNSILICNENNSINMFNFTTTKNHCYQQLDMNNNTIINSGLISTSQTVFSDDNLVTKKYIHDNFIQKNLNENQIITGSISITGQTAFQRLLYAFYTLNETNNGIYTGIVYSQGNLNPTENYSLTTTSRIRIPELNTTSSKFIKKSIFDDLNQQEKQKQVNLKIEGFIKTINPQFYSYKYRNEKTEQLGVYAEEILQSLVVQNSEFITDFQIQISKGSDFFYIIKQDLMNIIDDQTLKNTGIVLINKEYGTQFSIKQELKFQEKNIFIIDVQEGFFDFEKINVIDKIEILCVGIDQLKLNYANTCSIKYIYEENIQLKNKVQQLEEKLSEQQKQIEKILLQLEKISKTY